MICTFFFFALNVVNSQENLIGWKLKKEKDGIKVYTRDIEGTNIKELRITFIIEAELTAVAAIINDIPAYQDWVYRCYTAYTLKRVNPLETYDYYKVDFPWPFSDRDMIMHSRMMQDKNTKVITSITYAAPKYKKEEKGFVRILTHKNQWIFTPLSENRIEVDYQLNSDPAGNIPDWIVNLAIDQGPIQSMKKMQDLLASDIYKNRSVLGIENY